MRTGYLLVPDRTIEQSTGSTESCSSECLAPDERFSRVDAVPVEDSPRSDAWCLIVGRPV